MIFSATAFISYGVYVLYGIAAILPFVLLKRPAAFRDTLDPYVVTSLLLLFYIVSTVHGFEVTGRLFSLENVSRETIAKFGLVCVVGQLGLAVGEMVALTGIDRSERTNDERNDEFNLMILLGPALLFALATLPFYIQKLNFVSVASYADTAFSSRIERNADDTLGPTDVFLREIPASMLLCACTYIMFDARRLLPLRLGAGLVVGSFALTAMLGGARAELVSTLILPLLFYHYRIRRLPVVPVLLVAAAGYLVMNFIEIGRKSSDPAEMLDLVSQQITLEGFAFLNVERMGEFQTSQNLVHIISSIDAGEETFRYGVVTLFNVLSWVPRILWPGRPPTGSELFAEVFHPGSLEAGEGFGSFLFQDPYWDFGFPGVFVFAAALAWSMRHIHNELIVRRTGAFWVFLYAVAFNYMAIQVIRSGIFAGIKGGLVAAAPLIAIALLPRRTEAERSGV